MKTAPGSPKVGEQILGRMSEIDELWRFLSQGSVLFTAERRVGKSCILEKMFESPPEGWAAIKCDVESIRNPSEFVRKLFDQAVDHSILSKKTKWLGRFKAVYEKLSEIRAEGWSLPSVQSAWKKMLELLIEDICGHAEPRVVIILDEFPQMVANFLQDNKPEVASEILDTLRELRQAYQASGRICWLVAGSIGLHLVVEELKARHGYKGSPTNDMRSATLEGMDLKDVTLLCRKYLEEEGISRNEPLEFDRYMLRLTDGIPLYVEYLCDKFQAVGAQQVTKKDLDLGLEEMMDEPSLDWFWDAAQRIKTHYARLDAESMANAVLRLLSGKRIWTHEEEIFSYVRTQVSVEKNSSIQRVLELLCRDHYIKRSVVKAQRRYRFHYEIMRRWWQRNKA